MRCLLHMVFAFTCLGVSPQVQAQSTSLGQEVSMDDYLEVLQQLSPLARTAAEHYREGFRVRCGRSITAMELRRAFSVGRGEPVLMTMVTALAREDAYALSRLKDNVPCTWR